jgi:hypothetical protein
VVNVPATKLVKYYAILERLKAEGFAGHILYLAQQ